MRLARSRRRRGQALLEFAVIALILGVLLGGILSLGHAFFAANTLQQAADVGAHELARLPLPPGIQFGAKADAGADDMVLDRADVKNQLYDEEKLVVDVGTDASSLPLINRLLFTLYIYDSALGKLRYPGALVTKTSTGQPTVLIPLVASRDGDTGVETIGQWRPVVEEIRSDPSDPATGPFSVASTASPAGIVALRINYPFQAVGMVSYRPAGDGMVAPNRADDEAVSHADLPEGYSLFGGDTSGVPVYAGRFGLGTLHAFATRVRPYRKVISAQGVYRREVFE